MKDKMLKIGTEIYNGGDMANRPHFGKIEKINEATLCSPAQYKIKTDEKEYWVPVHMFSEEYKGHGGTRFVTKEAYLRWRAEQVKQMSKGK